MIGMNKLVVVLFAVFGVVLVDSQWPNCYQGPGAIQAIPDGHILKTKKTPLVIGHRGNPRHFQENTYDGFVSLLNTNADGFELDVFLTTDNKLVLFHDKNTQHLTGENKTMYDLTYEQVSKLNVKKTLHIGKNHFVFDKARKMPLLEDILKRFANESLLIFIEMKPWNPGLPNMDYVNKVGAAVGDIVKKYQLENKVVINSFDFWKVRAAKLSNPKLVVGNYFYISEFTDPNYDSHKVFGGFPGLEACSKAIPDRLEFLRYLYQTGAVLKSLNGSFFTLNYKVFNNPLTSNLTRAQMEANYKGQASGGAYTIYGMGLSIAEIDAFESSIDNMIKWGVDRLITDDPGRLLRKLDRAREPYPNCVDGKSGTIPSDHLFRTKRKPLIIGHRGNPKVYQENTMDGFNSLIDKPYVDGFELDVFLTKDKKLVLFHDADLYHLTGKKMSIYDSTYDEISKVMVKAKIEYGGKIFDFGKERPIPLLEDIYKKFQDKNFIIYTEIKSTKRDASRIQYANEVAQGVVDLIAKYKMEKKVMVNSFDPYTTLAVKKANPNLVVGTFFFRGEFDTDYDAKDEYSILPQLSSCLPIIPNGRNFTEFLLMTGAVLKSYGGAFFDMDYLIYPDMIKVASRQKLAKAYGGEISAGAWTIYKMTLDEDKLKETDVIVNDLVKWGAHRLITDDTTRLAKHLNRYTSSAMRCCNALSGMLVAFLTLLLHLIVTG